MLTDEALAKALDELEAAALSKGGDALQSQPHDGGLATEGTNIQSRSDAKKAMEKALEKSGYSKSARDKLLKMLSATDMGSEDDSDDDDDDDEEKPDLTMAKKGRTKQSANDSPPVIMSKAVDGDGSALRKALVDEVENGQEVLDAAPFLHALIDTIAKSDATLDKKSDTILKSVQQHQTAQRNFNVSLAKALVMIGEQLKGLDTRIEKIAAQPVSNHRSVTVSKSDIINPSFSNEEHISGITQPARSPLAQVEYLKIQEALVDIAMKGEVDITEVTKFENSKGNLASLPAHIVKALENRLCPAAS